MGLVSCAIQPLGSIADQNISFYLCCQSDWSVCQSKVSTCHMYMPVRLSECPVQLKVTELVVQLGESQNTVSFLMQCRFNKYHKEKRVTLPYSGPKPMPIFNYIV